VTMSAEREICFEERTRAADGSVGHVAQFTVSFSPSP